MVPLEQPGVKCPTQGHSDNMVSWYLSSGSWVQTNGAYNAHRKLSISVPIHFKSNCSAGSELAGSTQPACYHLFSWMLSSAARLFWAINAMWLISHWKIKSYQHWLADGTTQISQFRADSTIQVTYISRP